jgi:hypothetical protein
MVLLLLARQLLRHTKQRKFRLSYKYGSVSRFWYMYEDGLHGVPYSRVVPCFGVGLTFTKLASNTVLLA